MKEGRKLKSWVDKKLENPKFREVFNEEYEKLSIGEQIVRMRLATGLTQAELAKRVGTTAAAMKAQSMIAMRSVPFARSPKLVAANSS